MSERTTRRQARADRLHEWVDVRTSAELTLERRGRTAAGVLTVATALALAAPILTALCLFVLLTRRNI